MKTFLFFSFLFKFFWGKSTGNSQWKRFFVNNLHRLQNYVSLMSRFFVVLFIFAQPAISATICRPAKCDSFGQAIRFPFRLKGRQPVHCGYPGFDLSCNSQNQTILNLPQSGEFVLDYIDYSEQAISLNDPNLCLPKRILNFSLSGSPFQAAYTRNYTILNCSSDLIDYISYNFVPLFCLGGKNYSVFAMNSHSSDQRIPVTCRNFFNVSTPLRWSVSPNGPSVDLRDDLRLIWKEPGCGDCESQGRICGFKIDTGSEIKCSSPPNRGLPRSVKYGIIIGIGIPGLVFVIGLLCYTCGLLWAFTLRRSLNSEMPTTTISQQSMVRFSGLDGPTIASYPKMVLGESRRLPKPSDDVTCPICLADYQPKETLKTIPECNHYFHAACIDEWLMLNATCPICRTSPESSFATSCSSISLPSSYSSPSHRLD
ncbi:RING/U-box superfamily protein [Forsythia ovata]|uniref:RING-type E3 ubiquitin transferase n=1 Tax=Forsythia ovata TaxID=205694 RepID=A0ABD1W2G6_9LAMI